MTTLGNLILSLGTVAAMVSVVSLVVGHREGPKRGESVTNAGYLATYVVLAATTLALVVLTVAFFRNDWTFSYVAQNHSTDVSGLRWLYTLSALWAGREGSLLFWSWLLSCFAGYMAWKRMHVTDPLSNMGLMVLNAVQVLFLLALFIPTNNPFQASPAEWIGANGELLVSTAMNPLLQHWAMILHPPTLFIGYAGLTVPFAYAVAAIILKDGSKTWVELIDRVTVFAWLFMGIGIGLGAIWAYVVLGWGGYWAWDPVENASLLPWLTGVGLIHSFTVYRRREGFKKWAIAMATFTFVLVILGTFITRSGVVQSVHAFDKDPWSLGLFLFMMLAALVAGLGGMMWRGKTFDSKEQWESLTSKEAAYYFNNVLMLFAALLVAALTLSPALGGPTFGAASYDLLARPIGILYVAILVVCPILSWKKTEGPAFWKRFRWPFGLGVLFSAGFLALWSQVMLPNYMSDPKRLASLKGIASALPAIDHTEAVVGLVVAGMACALPLFLFFDGARRRAASKGESILSALGSILFKARTQSGGYLTHLGIGIILFGLIGSAMYVKDLQFTIPQKTGKSFKAGGYEFVYTGFREGQHPNGDVETRVNVDLKRGGVKLAAMEPGQLQYAVQGQTKQLADVRTELLRDVFLVFQGATDEEVSFNVKINPVISWTWAGFLLTILGTALAAWPRKRSA